MAEQFTNNAQTALAAPITSTTATSITVASATGFPTTAPVLFRILIDSELMLVTAVSGGSNNIWTVSRGLEGTAPAVHGFGATVTQVLTAAAMTAIEAAIAGPMFAQGRLTLTSATPVTASDVSGGSATTVYYTPYKGALISLYNSLNQWQHLLFSEVSLSVPGTPNQLYDVFGYISSGFLALTALAWTNDTTRATNLVSQDGVWVQSGDPTQRYLGSFRTLASGQSEDSVLRRWLWNNDNRVMRPMRFNDTTASWTYGSAAWRQDNANSAAQVDAVLGQVEDAVFVRHSMGVNTTGGDSTVLFSIGRNSVISPVNNVNGGVCGNVASSYAYSVATVFDLGYSPGRNTWQPLEYSQGNVTSSIVNSLLTVGVFGGLDGSILG